MKTKCMAINENRKEKFFLLMMAPLLLGLMITFISVGNAAPLEKKQSNPVDLPLQQGWDQYEGPTTSF